MLGRMATCKLDAPELFFLSMYPWRNLRWSCCQRRGHRFVVWVMKEPGSWTKELDLSYAHIHPLCFSYYLKPLFFYDQSGENLIKAFTSSTDIRKIFIYKHKPPTPSLVDKSFGCGVVDHFTYVERFAKL